MGLLSVAALVALAVGDVAALGLSRSIIRCFIFIMSACCVAAVLVGAERGFGGVWPCSINCLAVTASCSAIVACRSSNSTSASKHVSSNRCDDVSSA